jgi:hypothetical protein
MRRSARRLVSRKQSVLLAVLTAATAWAVVPLLPPRDYKTTVVAVTGDEAVALQTATAAMQHHLEKLPGKPSISSYFATIEKQAPSFWLVAWSLNDTAARGGGVDITLETTGTKVVALKLAE